MRNRIRGDGGAWLRLGLAVCGAWLAQAAWAANPVLEDCSKAQAPQRCEVYRRGLLSCNDLPDHTRRACLDFYTPALSCLRERDARRCEALQAAQSSCDGLQGEARRQCVGERLPAVDCGRVNDANRCNRRDSAEQYCISDGRRTSRPCARDGLVAD